ncbi:MAG: alpha/beta hydrolase [Herpetosiphon sp.]
MDQRGQEHGTGSYARVNGLKMYYEVHGTGEPLVLLHGGLMTIEVIRTLLGALAVSRQVIAVELEGHGRTEDLERPLSFEQMGDDVAALVTHLGRTPISVMGYSLGGSTALRMAIQHPEVVKKLVLVATPFCRDGWYPQVLVDMGQMSAASAPFLQEAPLYKSYAKVAPRPERFPVLLDKIGELLRQPYDWSTEVAGLTMPTMVVFGDADAIPPTHAARFFELLGGGREDAGWEGRRMPIARLAILPATTHYNIDVSPALVASVLPFLHAPMPGTA